VIPRWLGEKGVNVVLTGGIGQKAVQLFQQYNIIPVIGVPEKPAKELIVDFVEGRIESGLNQCSH
jgi:predicted Fe-Mo cluster-binding NifX family protein